MSGGDNLEGRASLEAAILKSMREAGWRNRALNIDEPREDNLEELDTVVNAFFPELRMKSKYTQEITQFTGTHNWRPFGQRQSNCSVPPVFS